MVKLLCCYGTYKFELMPFGSMNSHSKFHKMIDSVLQGFPFVMFYVDDMVMFFKIIDEHVDYTK